MKKYMFQRIRPPRDKRLLQIDKLKHRCWILLIRAYLLELSPNQKQRQFVSWYWKRKGSQRRKQIRKETRELKDRGNELNYSNHGEEEKNAVYNGKIYSKKMLQIQDSSLLFSEKIENSEVYKKFKIYIREANRILSTSQKKASRNRHLKEAKALLEIDEEKVEIIDLLQKILNTIRSSKSSRTHTLLRKVLSSFIIVTYYALQGTNNSGHQSNEENQKGRREELIPLTTNMIQMEKKEEGKEKEENSSKAIESSVYDQESIYRHLKKATIFLDCEKNMFQSNKLSEKVNQPKNSRESRLVSSIVYNKSYLMQSRSGIELEAIIAHTMEQQRLPGSLIYYKKF
jgi:hypothetical protein